MPASPHMGFRKASIGARKALLVFPKTKSAFLAPMEAFLRPIETSAGLRTPINGDQRTPSVASRGPMDQDPRICLSTDFGICRVVMVVQEQFPHRYRGPCKIYLGEHFSLHESIVIEIVWECLALDFLSE